MKAYYCNSYSEGKNRFFFLKILNFSQKKCIFLSNFFFNFLFSANKNFNK